jgi:hypothetical protein
MQNSSITAFGPKRDEVVGGWKILRYEEFGNVCSSPNVISVIRWRRMGWAGHVTCMGDVRNAYKTSGGKSEEKRPLRRTRCR